MNQLLLQVPCTQCQYPKAMMSYFIETGESMLTCPKCGKTINHLKIEEGDLPFTATYTYTSFVGYGTLAVERGDEVYGSRFNVHPTMEEIKEMVDELEEEGAEVVFLSVYEGDSLMILIDKVGLQEEEDNYNKEHGINSSEPSDETLSAFTEYINRLID